MAILTAIALIIFVIEAQIPPPLPVPGAKLGFANIITLFALFWGKNKLTTVDVLMILICRILLGAAFTGRATALIYSLAGGVTSFAVMAMLRRVVTIQQIWVCGAIGAVVHNVAQIAAAILITGTPAIAAYLPVLIIAGIAAGLMTGIIAQLVIRRLEK